MGPPMILNQAQGLGSQHGLDQPKGGFSLCQNQSSLRIL